LCSRRWTYLKREDELVSDWKGKDWDEVLKIREDEE